MEALHEALNRDETRAEACEHLRSLIDGVAVRPRAGGGYEVEVVGEDRRNGGGGAGVHKRQRRPGGGGAG